MILAGATALMMFVFGGAGDEAPALDTEMAQVTIRQQIIVRVPRGGLGAPHGSTPVHWREGRGPRCVAARTVRGATLAGRDSVDLVLRDNSRIRARLDRSCLGLDFYQGFYVNGTEDGMICADRDSIRSRMGGHCEIDQFRSLTAIRP
ncbi:hypothetical protein [Allosphingosinicella sp.]|jgi:hypothetical protein|uniref:hypothetical protein n=1 Tax=Allosphingosinicella sp. TaxID=2823234 RepID=UPI002F258B21